MTPLEQVSDLIISQEDMGFGALQQVIPGSRVYYAAGYINSGDQDMFADSAALREKFSLDPGVFRELGELAEKPGKVDSKNQKLKTQNYLIPGRRSSTVELTVCGLSALQKDYLESSLFQGAIHTILLCDKDMTNLDPELEEVRLVVLSGLSWGVEWSGEADGLWSVVITTEIQGATEDVIYPVLVPVYVPET